MGDPSGHSFVVVGGDFKSLEVGEKPSRFDTGTTPDMAQSTVNSTAGQLYGQAVLSGYVDIPQPAVIRTGSRTTTDEDDVRHLQLVGKRLDRIYISLPQ